MAWVSRTNKLCEDLVLKKMRNCTESLVDITLKCFALKRSPWKVIVFSVLFAKIFCRAGFMSLISPQPLHHKHTHFFPNILMIFFFVWYSLAFPLFWDFLGIKSGPFRLFNLPLPSHQLPLQLQNNLVFSAQNTSSTSSV